MDSVGFDELLTEFSNALKKASFPKITKLNPPSLNADDDNDTKRKAFKEALSELSKPDNIGCLESQGISAFIAFFKALYGGDVQFRHLYSDICSIMYEKLEKEGGLDEGTPPELMSLATNMGIISQEIDKGCEDDDVKKSVRKLHDHIELERTRIVYMVRQNANQKEAKLAAEKALAQANEMAKSFEEKTKRDSQKFREMLDESKRDYVTILGIFAAIVLAFTAGLSFSSSILQNINQASIYRLSFIAVFIGFFIFNIIIALFAFLTAIAKPKKPNTLSAISTKGNAIFIALLILIIIARALNITNCFAG